MRQLLKLFNHNVVLDSDSDSDPEWQLVRGFRVIFNSFYYYCYCPCSVEMRQRGG